MYDYHMCYVPWVKFKQIFLYSYIVRNFVVAICYGKSVILMLFLVNFLWSYNAGHIEEPLKG